MSNETLRGEYDTLVRAACAYTEVTRALLTELLLRDRISLDEVPLPVRADEGVYVASLRNSRYRYNHFVRDLRIMMSDVEKLPRAWTGMQLRLPLGRR